MGPEQLLLLRLRGDIGVMTRKGYYTQNFGIGTEPLVIQCPTEMPRFFFFLAESVDAYNIADDKITIF